MFPSFRFLAVSPITLSSGDIKYWQAFPSSFFKGRCGREKETLEIFQQTSELICIHFINLLLMRPSSTPKSTKTLRMPLRKLAFPSGSKMAGGMGRERKIEEYQNISLNDILPEPQHDGCREHFWTSFTHRFYFILMILKNNICHYFPSCCSSFWFISLVFLKWCLFSSFDLILPFLIVLCPSMEGQLRFSVPDLMLE